MQSRRKIIVIAVAVLIGLLFLGAVALLVLGFLKFYEAQSVLEQSKGTLESLYDKNPFPSHKNFELERANIESVRTELTALQAALGEGQVEPSGQNPAQFVNLFFETQRGLLSKATVATITVPKNFDFGFGRHMAGNLPAPQDVPRLTQQLKVVETLCNILYDAKISKLSGIARQEFEVDATANAAPAPKPAPGRGKPVVAAPMDLKNIVDASAGVVPQGQLFGKWHFAIQFSGRESAVMNTLNGLARSPMFVVVTRLTIQGDEKLFSRKESVAVKAGADEPPEVKQAPKSKDYRIVSGRDAQMDVKLELDVYQFAKPQANEAAKQPGGVK